jgi:hypothetical protein
VTKGVSLNFGSLIIPSSICQEFAGTDAAPDELKAMRITKQNRLHNIRVRLRDGAHAAGRLGLTFQNQFS